MRPRTIQNGGFLTLLALVTVAFFWLIRDFLLPVFWAAVLAILFHPLQRRWVRLLGGRAFPATLLNILVIVLIVILPLAFVGFAVTREAINLYERIAAGEIDVQAPVRWIRGAIPDVAESLERYGVDISRIEEGVSSAAATVSGFLASRALAIGQNTVRIVALFFLMLYVLFFFLRDGPRILDGIVRALPLGRGRERRMFARFAEVARGTVKGTLVVGLVQGTLGGLMFWVLGIAAPILWGTIMVVLSILPAVGAGLVWVPASIILIVSGELAKGVILIVVGTLVIGLVDNFLRPLLVGRDTKMPDYLILISTLGGLTLFGLAGFVLGPVIASLFLIAWEMFEHEMVPEKDVAAVKESARTGEPR